MQEHGKSAPAGCAAVCHNLASSQEFAMSQFGTCCLSPQEERVINKHVNREGRERIYTILDRNQFMIPHVDVERAKYFTESMRETEGELLTLRWAKALKNVAEKITVWITPNQLLAGRVGQLGRYGILYPEIDGDFYREVLAGLEHRDKSPFQISRKISKPLWKTSPPTGKARPTMNI